MDDLIYQSAKRLAEAIQHRDISSVELVTACISRIEAVNPAINAVVQKTFDRALDQARQADESLSRGESLGPLHGVPMTIKDCLDTANVITTAGTKGRAAYVPPEDATVVARLRNAGAILLGKTNTSELTLTGITDNYLFGRTNNPYNLAHTPGGSSGGAAAIVAAGGVPFDIGSDAGGSVRMPSHYCGIAGIKPTAGRVPKTGHVPGFDVGVAAPFNHIGPLARFVEDLSLLLSIISGVDRYDPTTVPMPLRNLNNVPLAELRVAYYDNFGHTVPTDDTKRVFREALDVLSDIGVTLVEDQPQGLGKTPALFGGLATADGGAPTRRILEKWGTDLSEMHPSIGWTQYDPQMSTADLNALIAEWNSFRSQMQVFFSDYDAIISPASSSPAPVHGDDESRDFSFTQSYNLTGWPATVVRAGSSSAGLPIGVQIIAHPWREDLTLAIAQKIEDELGGWQLPPF